MPVRGGAIRNESIPVLRANSEHGLVHEFEMYTSTVARHGAIERWFPMQEIDGETESVPEKLSRRLHIGNKDHRHGARESRCRRHGFGLRGLIGNRDLQCRPVRVARLQRDDLLRLAKWKLKRERLTVGQRLVAGETANAPPDRVVAPAMPANELFCLLLVDVETRHEHTLPTWLL